MTDQTKPNETQTATTLAEDLPDISQARRGFLTGAASLAGASMLVQSDDVFAMADKAEKSINQTVSEHARATTLPKDAFDLPRWTPKKTGTFNLSNSEDNHFAFAKAQATLSGGYAWLAQYGWICICPPGKAPYPFLGRLTLVKVFATSAEYVDVQDVGPDDYAMWGTFTTTHVDPRTFEPVSRLRNPYNGKMIDTPTIEYADKLTYRKGKSIVVPGVDPAFYTQPWDRDGGFSQHYIDAGDEVSYTVLGAAQKDSAQQPRLDVGFWSVKRDELMNPSLKSIDTRRDYTAIQKMSEYAWYGAERGDEAQILVHLTGLKTSNIARLPKPVLKHVLEPNKKRFGM